MANTLTRFKSGAHKLKSGARKVQEDLYRVKSGITKVVNRTARTIDKISKTTKKFATKSNISPRNTGEPNRSTYPVDVKDDTGKGASIYNLSETGGRIVRNLANPRGQVKVAKSSYKQAKYVLKQKKAELKAMKIDRKLQKAQKTKKL